MRAALAAAVLALCAPAFAQTQHYSGDRYSSDRSGRRTGDEALTCPQLQAEYDAAVSDAAMSAEYSGGGDEGGDASGGGGPSLASMGGMAMGAVGSMGGGMGSGAGAAMQGMSMGMGGGSGGMIPGAGAAESQGGAQEAGGRPSSWAMARANRVRALARTKNCALIQRAPGWERRTAPPLAPSAPLDTSPEALDGGEAPDSEGGPALDSEPEAAQD